MASTDQGVFRVVFLTLRKGVLSILLMGLFLTLAACSSDAPPSLEERAQSIHKQLICLQCPGETIDQSQVELAAQMRAAVWERLQDGWTREEILQYFVDRYGEAVLAAPPKKGFSLLAWVVPPIGLAGALVLLLLVVRSMRVRSDPPVETAEPGEIGEYLAMADAEMEGSVEGHGGSAQSAPDEGRS